MGAGQFAVNNEPDDKNNAGAGGLGWGPRKKGTTSIPEAWDPRCEKATDRLRPGKPGLRQGRYGARTRLPGDSPHNSLLAGKLSFPTVLCGWLLGLSASGRQRPPLGVRAWRVAPPRPHRPPIPGKVPAPTRTIRPRKMLILCCVSSLIGLGGPEGHSAPQEGRGLPTKLPEPAGLPASRGRRESVKVENQVPSKSPPATPAQGPSRQPPSSCSKTPVTSAPLHFPKHAFHPGLLLAGAPLTPVSAPAPDHSPPPSLFF